MNLDQVLDRLRVHPRYSQGITAWKILPPLAARYAPFPAWLRPELVAALHERGVTRLYSHQVEAIEAAFAGRDVVTVTPTASGKTLCYNLPVLNAILNEPESRALYLFPTKALAQDQMAELYALTSLCAPRATVHTYDGDTPSSARQAIRKAAHIVVTNPDMLHTGILPHHARWVKLFENLRFVVIDELHHYRGVFGSHLANVIRRLHRICSFYGSSPQFIMCSATIANPGELAARLTGRPAYLVADSGAPRPEKHFIFYNPPVVNRPLGIRRSSLLEARVLASLFLGNHIQTIIFTRTRRAVEVLLTYLRGDGRRPPGMHRIRGYRGGYLPAERREIEKGLREGHILGVVSTNALELGIDIGQMDACIMVGYPGTIASTWQQAGRAGRRAGTSVALLVASSNPLDQYIVTHPEYFFQQNPEHGLINPDNIFILLSHLKCAAFELPFREGEEFGPGTTADMLAYLEEERILHKAGDRWYWSSESFPAEEVSLRSAATDNFVVVDISETARVVGEVDSFSAPLLLHEEAIYIHGAQQYQVERLDYPEKKAYVRQVSVDYYTDASMAVNLSVLDVLRDAAEDGAHRSYGEVQVTALPTVFKKIKFYTHENVGWGRIHLPEQEMHTTACWFALTAGLDQALPPGELEVGLVGVATLLANVAPLYLMCDRRDVSTAVQVRSPFTGLPTIFVYDNYPGGVGLSEKLYDLYRQVLATAREVLEACPCREGCPSCTGPTPEPGYRGKAAAGRILRALTGPAGEGAVDGPAG